ncbi:MAG: hypothetical protein R6V25_00385 [Desulfatiglandales bacterium]
MAKRHPSFNKAQNKPLFLKKALAFSCFLFVAGALSWDIYPGLNIGKYPKEKLVINIQDGNDLFYALPHPITNSAIKAGIVETFKQFI